MAGWRLEAMKKDRSNHFYSKILFFSSNLVFLVLILFHPFLSIYVHALTHVFVFCLNADCFPCQGLLGKPEGWLGSTAVETHGCKSWK